MDPFVGSGATVLAAQRLNRKGIGFDLSPDYIELARSRFSQAQLFTSTDLEPTLILADARKLTEHLEPNSIDFCLTSPPYWNILTAKRTADYKETRHYGNYLDDLGNIDAYEEFLIELKKVWREVFIVLKPNKYFIVNVMDLRKKAEFIPLHIDVSRTAQDEGFTLDDIIIWDRSAEYNNLRALGYPAVFRLNKVHEFLMIFQKRI